MKSKIKYSLIALCFTICCKAQTWSSVGSGITSPAANSTWSLFAYDSVLYAGGWFNNAGGVSVGDFAQWNGANWAATGAGSSGYVNAMAIYNGNLYVGGKFDTMGGTLANDVATWNGSSWSAMGNGIKSQQYGVYSMATYNGNLYVGGSFDSAGGKQIYGVAKWDGTNWRALGSGVYAKDEDDGVFAMTGCNGKLYIAGGMDSAGGIKVHEIASWDGTNWADVGGGTNGNIYSIAVYNGNLYVGGLFDSAGGKPANGVAMWDGTKWNALDSGITGEMGWAEVDVLCPYNGKLYAGGYFDTVNGKPMNCIAAWDGTAWSSVGSGIGVGGSLVSMAVYNNSLFVGGGFDSVGGIYASNIAMWTTPSGIENISSNNRINIYPNPAANYLSVISTEPITNAEYFIYNELGQQVVSGTLNSKQVQVNITTLSPGLYILRIINSKEEYRGKFIKQ